MTVPKPRRRCKECRRTDDIVGKISRKGFCAACSNAAYLAAQTALATKQGEVFERWRQGMLAAGGFDGRPTTPFPPDA